MNLAKPAGMAVADGGAGRVLVGPGVGATDVVGVGRNAVVAVET